VVHNFSGNPLIEKTLAVVLLLFFLMAGYLLFSNIYLNQLYILDKGINLKLKKVSKVESILGKEAELKAKISVQKKRLDKNKIFLTNTKPSTASTELQNKIKRLIVSKSKAKILTIKPHPFVKFDNYTETSIEIRMKNIGHNGIKNIIYLIENSSPTLIIKELDIKRTQLRYKTLVKSKGSVDKLEVILVVSAFFRGNA
jgi:hypothetical protein